MPNSLDVNEMMNTRFHKQINRLDLPWPHVAMEKEFKKLSLATHELLATYRKCGEDLELPREFFAGLIVQTKLLDRLRRLNAKLGDQSPVGAKMDRLCFGRLRNAYSLFPQNPFLWIFFRDYCRLLSEESSKKLSSYTESKIVVLHVSCHARLDRAQRSIDSFGDYGDDVNHLIVVGSRKNHTRGLRFHFDSEILELPVPDTYEFHCVKCLHAYTVMSLMCKPVLLIKVDDDVRLSDVSLFDAHLSRLLSSKAEYAGMLTPKPTPTMEAMWHGWHVGKCSDKRLEKLGYQVPIPQVYAEGGFSYALGLHALDAIAKFYLHHRELLSARSIMFEDATVGLALELAGISPTAVAPASMGLTSERHRMQETLNDRWALFQQRLAPATARLTSAYLASNPVLDE